MSEKPITDKVRRTINAAYQNALRRSIVEEIIPPDMRETVQGVDWSKAKLREGAICQFQNPKDGVMCVNFGTPNCTLGTICYSGFRNWALDVGEVSDTQRFYSPKSVNVGR